MVRLSDSLTNQSMVEILKIDNIGDFDEIKYLGPARTKRRLQ